MTPIRHYRNFHTNRAFCGAEAESYHRQPNCAACVEIMLGITEQLARCDAATLDALEYVGTAEERDRAAGNLYASQQSAAAWRELLARLRQAASQAAVVALACGLLCLAACREPQRTPARRNLEPAPPCSPVHVLPNPPGEPF